MTTNPSDVKPPVGTITPAAPGSVKPVTPEPAKPVQQPPAASKPGVTPEPGGVKPEPQTVPVSALLDERSKRQALEAELALLRQPTAMPVQQSYQQPPVNQAYQEVEKLWDTDPRRAVQAEILTAIEWYDKVNGAIDQQADILSNKYADFNDHRSAAQRYVRSLPATQRANPGVLEMAYFIVRGQSVDDVLKRQEQTLMERFHSGELAANYPSGTVSRAAPNTGINLTDEQRAVANAMGLTEDAYASQIKLTPERR